MKLRKLSLCLVCFFLAGQGRVGLAEDRLANWNFISEEYSDDELLPGIDPFMVKGSLVSAGSSTVYPLLERMVLRFVDEGFMGSIFVDSIGSGAGFERFCTTGETDIANASRPIKAKEVDNCMKIGRRPVEFRIGTDALAIVISKDNDFARNATMEELGKLFSTAVNWSDVNPDWPDRPIQRFIPGTDSGTFDYFVEEVFHNEKEPLLSTGNLQMSEDDNILVQGVMGSPYAVGFLGYAYYRANMNNLRILDIEGVEASKESVDNASYPLARPMYVYTTANIMREKPQVAAFINFLLTYVNEEIVDVGYFPANERTLFDAKETWMGIVSN